MHNLNQKQYMYNLFYTQGWELVSQMFVIISIIHVNIWTDIAKNLPPGGQNVHVPQLTKHRQKSMNPIGIHA